MSIKIPLSRAHKENHRFIGVFERRTPKILILDTKLVSDVYVKYFKHFQVNDSSNSVSANYPNQIIFTSIA